MQQNSVTFFKATVGLLKASNKRIACFGEFARLGTTSASEPNPLDTVHSLSSPRWCQVRDKQTHHFVGEDAVEVIVVEGHHPLQADHLVLPQRGPWGCHQRAWRLPHHLPHTMRQAAPTPHPTVRVSERKYDCKPEELRLEVRLPCCLRLRNCETYLHAGRWYVCATEA